jgi:hypothetical protein
MGVFKCMCVGAVGATASGVGAFKLVSIGDLQSEGWGAFVFVAFLMFTTITYLITRKP